ncbi:hypothetical protein HDF16_005836 [Granulicella aggregans]|uniref:Uncharacterized protein n=1 Tax=Granulicella aggregans TaxID=474949 RepID=A0A7W8E8B4_9BACT|nr:hypothetical protein [Granulicella aggregans]
MAFELYRQHVDEADGPAYSFLNSLNILKATSDSTGGAFSMVFHMAPLGMPLPFTYTNWKTRHSMSWMVSLRSFMMENRLP